MPDTSRCANRMAFTSACIVRLNLVARSVSSSGMLRGGPLYPWLISRFPSAMTAPTFVDGSFDHCALCRARFSRRVSHLLVMSYAPARHDFAPPRCIVQLVCQLGCH